MDPSSPSHSCKLRAHFVENDNQLICDVIEFAWGHAVDYSIERHATAFIYEEIPHAVRYPILGLDNGFGG